MRTPFLVSTALVAVAYVAGTSPAFAQAAPAESISNWPDRTTLQLPLSTYQGTIGKDYTQSEAVWQQVPTAPAGAPNILVILLDDVGFGQPSTFGGLIPTPNLDRLAAEGLKFNRFH